MLRGCSPRLWIPLQTSPYRLGRAVYYPNSLGRLYYPDAPSEKPVHAWVAASLTMQVVSQYLHARLQPSDSRKSYYERVRGRVEEASYRVGRRRYRLRDLRLPECVLQCVQLKPSLPDLSPATFQDQSQRPGAVPQTCGCSG